MEFGKEIYGFLLNLWSSNIPHSEFLKEPLHLFQFKLFD